MYYLRKEWLILFAGTKYGILINSVPVSIVCNDNIIINDILLYFNQFNKHLYYFCCVAQFF